MFEMLASQVLLPWPATKGKESQTLGGGGDPPQGAFDGIQKNCYKNNITKKLGKSLKF